MLDGIEAAKEAGFAPVKINAVVERGVNDDEIVDLATFGREQRRRGAVHRVHAARRRRALGQRAGRRPGRDRRRDRRRVPARADAVTRRGAGRSLALPRRRRHGRRDPDGHQAVLRRLRPRAAHRRWPVPHVPVRDDEFDLLEVLRAGGADDERGRGDRGRGRHEVGGPPDQPGELRPPEASR